MLPQHRDEIRRHRTGLKVRPKPELDHDAIEEIERVIGEAAEMRESVMVTVYGEYCDREVTGVVERIDPLTRRLRIGEEYIMFQDILNAEKARSE
ncbi:YolD-like family protein [Paenibacillus alkalitolerans]|uniref:YolD-like family protein n=1 Tax=Paenibacillus alkalitolerans TaxID=2799335 RepID=UPI0018F4A653|nr:YolD-like family protein [Paenibacillus alkalitolerans]